VAAGQLYVARTATVDATLVGDRYWAVTVAVELLEAVKGAFRPLGTRYFAVGIRMDAGRLVATSLPAAVPAPATAALPRLAVATMAVPQPGDPVADTVSHFLAALLTGQGELDRYVDPASGLAAITPPPFAALRVRQLGQRTLDGHRRLVRVEAAAVDAAGHATVLAYALELEQADGRWEVVRLDRAAPLLTATLPTGR
jgi:hypothetical protein